MCTESLNPETVSKGVFKLSLEVLLHCLVSKRAEGVCFKLTIMFEILLVDICPAENYYYSTLLMYHFYFYFTQYYAVLLYNWTPKVYRAKVSYIVSYTNSIHI